MNRLTRLFTITALLAFIFSNSLMAQPLPGGSPVGVGQPVGGGPLGGPVSDSLWMPLLIAMAYGMYKIYQLRLSRKEA
ncbi:MAG: hypothetical protein NTU98_05055 [Bacteroidetes bacterium]|nr:hypothetical protein [Bacteroidota bacterium]